jgi:hypothetical protein
MPQLMYPCQTLQLTLRCRSQQQLMLAWQRLQLMIPCQQQQDLLHGMIPF